MNDSRLLSHAGAARYLGVSPTTLRDKLRNKVWNIPTTHLEGQERLRYDRRDLDEFIQSRKVAN